MGSCFSRGQNESLVIKMYCIFFFLFLFLIGVLDVISLFYLKIYIE